jgi:putative ABC transport system permease protein
MIGTMAAAFSARILRSQLCGITPADPLTFMIAPVLLLAVAALACCLPALRATHLDPTVALRAE